MRVNTQRQMGGWLGRWRAAEQRRSVFLSVATRAASPEELTNTTDITTSSSQPLHVARLAIRDAKKKNQTSLILQSQSNFKEKQTYG